MRALTLCLCLALLPGVAAARPSGERALKTDGAFFALSVRDLQASAAWYARVFGLEVAFQVPAQNGIAVTVLEGKGWIVELIQNDRARPLAEVAPGVTDPQLVHGIYKVGVIVKDFDGTVARLREAGAEIVLGPYPAGGGQRANVIIRDNSGNLLQLFGD